MKNKIEMLGKKFNRLLVIGTSDVKTDGKAHWLCRCDCGLEKVVMGKMLRNNNTKSCGCLQKEKARARMIIYGKEHKSGLKHGMSKTRIHECWKAMNNRCRAKIGSKSYKYYSGRGIKVCDRWSKFENFYEDMKDTYADNLTLDRIDVNGNYEPKNCRWITLKEQAMNRTSNHWIKHKGKNMTVEQWATYLGIPRVRINNRLCRGMKIKDVLNPNVMPRNNHKGCKYITRPKN